MAARIHQRERRRRRQPGGVQIGAVDRDHPFESRNHAQRRQIIRRQVQRRRDDIVPSVEKAPLRLRQIVLESDVGPAASRQQVEKQLQRNLPLLPPILGGAAAPANPEAPAARRRRDAGKGRQRAERAVARAPQRQPVARAGDGRAFQRAGWISAAVKIRLGPDQPRKSGDAGRADHAGRTGPHRAHLGGVEQRVAETLFKQNGGPVRPDERRIMAQPAGQDRREILCLDAGVIELEPAIQTMRPERLARQGPAEIRNRTRREIGGFAQS